MSTWRPLLLCAFCLAPCILRGQSSIREPDSMRTGYDPRISFYQRKARHLDLAGALSLGAGIILPLVANRTPGRGFRDVSNVMAVAGPLASLPLFFSAISERNKADLVRMEDRVLQSPDSISRQENLKYAAGFFRAKSRKASGTAWAELGIGGGLMVLGGILAASDHAQSNGVIDLDIQGALGALFLITGAIPALVSIPTFCLKTKYQRTERFILETGRIPAPGLSMIRPCADHCSYFALGVQFTF